MVFYLAYHKIYLDVLKEPPQKNPKNSFFFANKTTIEFGEFPIFHC